METVKRSVVAMGVGEKGMKKWSKEDFYVSENTVCDTIMVDTCHLSEHIECTARRMNSNINYGLWVIIMC